jgi:hypothetical protein
VPGDPSGLAGQARHEARHILSQPPFSTPPGHSAIDDFFHDLGHWLYDVVGPVWRFVFDHVLLPIRNGLSGVFGSWWPVPLGVIVVAVALVIGVRLGRRRARVGVARAGRVAEARDEDPDALDAAAEEAEQHRDYDLAVRLRFRAGLARLERGGLISGRQTHTSAQLARVLRSPTFVALAGQLEGIVYAGHTATADDVGMARSGWPRIPVEARQAATVGAGGAQASSPASGPS